MNGKQYVKTRLSLNLSQTELANALGISRATISRRENREFEDVSTEARLALKLYVETRQRQREDRS